MENYIAFITARIILIKELLSDDGFLWVHIDWHSSHYIRLIMDEIFGADNFINEIIWKYKSGGSSNKHFSRKHDSILLYSKTDKYQLKIPKEKSYNRNLKPYKFKGVSEYEDKFGWYTMVNMKDVWSIDMVGRTSTERTGYATQKPLELLSRIIESSSNEGDLCADFFCGSGSFLHAADKLNRRWIGCDNEKLAISIARKRMGENSSNFVCYYEKTGSANADKVGATNSENIQFSCQEFKISDSAKKLMVFRLVYFKPSINLDHVSSKDRSMVEDLIKKEPLSFVKYIMVDNDYSGVFRPEIIEESAESEIRFFSKGNIKFTVIDVFGNEYEQIID